MDSPASHFNFLFLQNRQASPRFNTLLFPVPLPIAFPFAVLLLLLFPLFVKDEWTVDAVEILLKLDPDPV
jgi:hypothetical protein